MANITKQELVNRITQIHLTRSGMTKKVIQAFLDEIINELANGNRLEFRDFGVFETKSRPARSASSCWRRGDSSRAACVSSRSNTAMAPRVLGISTRG